MKTKKIILNIIFWIPLLVFTFSINSFTNSFNNSNAKSNQTNIFNNNQPSIQNNSLNVEKTTLDTVTFSVDYSMGKQSLENITNRDAEVTLYDSSSPLGEAPSTYTASFVDISSQHNNKVTVEYQITNLNPNTTYYIDDFSNSNTSNNLNYNNMGDNSFTTLATGNSYIVDDTFAILHESVTESSVQFQMDVVLGDSAYDPHDDLYVKLNNSGTTPIIATYQSTENENTYIYEIDGLEANKTYNIYSLVNSGLATSDSTNPIDDEIILGNEISVIDNSFTTNSENPYIVDNSFSILTDSITFNSMQFVFTVDKNDGSFDPTKGIQVKLNGKTGEIVDANYVDTIDTSTYIFEIDNLTPNTNYTIYSLVNTGLAVSSSSNAIDNEIVVTDDLGVVDNAFTTLENNPFIIDNGFEIIDSSITSNSMEFSLTVTNTDGSFNYSDDIQVKLNDNAGEIVNATYQRTIGSDTYVYKIDGLDSNTNYTIYSIENSGLAVGDSQASIDNSIILNEDLMVDNNTFTTLEANPYIVTDGFSINNDTIAANSVEFAITIDDPNGNFDYTNSIQVRMENATGEIKLGTYKRKEGANTYVYEISGLEANTTYTIYSLVDTGLAVDSPNNSVDDEIILSTDLLTTDDTFTTLELNPYIVDGGFNILDNTLTANSIEFSLTVIDPKASFDYTQDIQVKMNDASGTIVNATYQRTKSTNTYIYLITDLSPDTTYTIYSLVDTGLTVSSSSNSINDEIIVDTDLMYVDNTFVTNQSNPYIEDGGFNIINDSITDTSVQFSINVYNNMELSFVPENDIAVRLNDATGEIVFAHYVNKIGDNTYVYQIDDLTPDTTYTIYSLIETELTVSDSTNSVVPEIVLNVDLMVSNNTFTTSPEAFTGDNTWALYLLPLILLFIILIIALITTNSMRRRNKLS